MPEYTSDLIKWWYDKWKHENENYITKFIYLWISFNGFYEAFENLNNDGEKNNSDREKINMIITNYNDIFENLHQNENITKFYNFINNREFSLPFPKWIICWPKGIINVKNYYTKKINKDTNESDFEYQNNYIKYKNKIIVILYEDKSDLESFINIIYQIRCNLFHGSKEITSEANYEIMKYSSLALQEFLDKLYDIDWLVFN